MTAKIIVFLLIVAIVCTIIGGLTEVGFFTTVGIIGFCGAGVVFLIWVFDKLFLKK